MTATGGQHLTTTLPDSSKPLPSPGWNKPLPYSPGSSKPLPSPPVISVIDTTTQSQSRTLIDAAEKPLRRSPQGDSTRLEEWPVLSPETPTAPNILSKMTHSPNDVRFHASEKDEIERYPSVNRLPSSKLRPPQQNKSVNARRILPLASAGASSETTVVRKSGREEGSVIDKSGGDKGSTPKSVKPAKSVTVALDTSHPLTPGSAPKRIVSKAAVPHPRPTRTSALRASLSAQTQHKQGSAHTETSHNKTTNENSSPLENSKLLETSRPRADTTTSLQNHLATRASSSSSPFASIRHSATSRRPSVVYRTANKTFRRNMGRSRVSQDSGYLPKVDVSDFATPEEMFDAATKGSKQSSLKAESSKRSSLNATKRRSAIPISAFNTRTKYSITTGNQVDGDNAIGSVPPASKSKGKEPTYHTFDSKSTGNGKEQMDRPSGSSSKGKGKEPMYHSFDSKSTGKSKEHIDRPSGSVSNTKSKESMDRPLDSISSSKGKEPMYRSFQSKSKGKEPMYRSFDSDSTGAGKGKEPMYRSLGPSSKGKGKETMNRPFDSASESKGKELKHRPFNSDVKSKDKESVHRPFDIFEEPRVGTITKPLVNIAEKTSASGDAAKVQAQSRRFSSLSVFHKSKTVDELEPEEDYKTTFISRKNPTRGPRLKIYDSAEDWIMAPRGDPGVSEGEMSGGDEEETSDGSEGEKPTSVPGTDNPFRRPSFKQQLSVFARNAQHRATGRKASSRAATSLGNRQVARTDRSGHAGSRVRASTVGPGPLRVSRPLSDFIKDSKDVKADDPFFRNMSAETTDIPEPTKEVKDVGLLSDDTTPATANFAESSKLARTTTSISKRSVAEEAEWISPLSQPRNSLLHQSTCASPVSMLDETVLEVDEGCFQAGDVEGEGKEKVPIRSAPSGTARDVGRQSVVNEYENAAKNTPRSYPVRKSSKNALKDLVKSAEASGSGSSKDQDAPPSAKWPKDFRERQNQLGQASGFESKAFATPELGTKLPVPTAAKRESSASLSTKSQAAATKKGVLRKVRGLFPKRAANAVDPEPSNHGSKKDDAVAARVPDPPPTLTLRAPGPRAPGRPLLPPGLGLPTEAPPSQVLTPEKEESLAKRQAEGQYYLDLAQEKKGTPVGDAAFVVGTSMTGQVLLERDHYRELEVARAHSRDADQANNRALVAVWRAQVEGEKAVKEKAVLDRLLAKSEKQVKGE